MNIKETATKEAAKAFELLGALKSEITLRLGLENGTWDPVTETSASTWAFESVVESFVYDTGEAQGLGGPEIRMRTFLVLGSSLGEVNGDQDGEIVFEGKTWPIHKVESDPTQTVWIFYALK